MSDSALRRLRALVFVLCCWWAAPWTTQVHAPGTESEWPEVQLNRAPAPPPQRPQWGEFFCGATEYVKVDYLRPQMQYACEVVDEVWQRHGARAVVTGHGREEAYRYERLHRVGLAADFRTRNLGANTRSPSREVCLRLRDRDPRYRVVLFHDDPDHGNHTHIEWRDEEEITWTEAYWEPDWVACPHYSTTP